MALDLALFAGIVLGLTQVVKWVLAPNSRWVAPLAIVLSIVLLYIYVFLEGIKLTGNMLLLAIEAALMAGGAWSGTKSVLSK